MPPHGKTPATLIGGGAELAFAFERSTTRTIVTVSGQLDRETANRFAAALAEGAKGSQFVDLDLRLVKHMDSQGLRILIATSAAEPGQHFKVTEASAQVRSLLVMTGLADVLGLRALEGAAGDNAPAA